MTLDDLVKLIRSARDNAYAKWVAAPDDGHDITEDELEAAGIRAVVAALREEMSFWTKDCHACDRANDTLNEILQEPPHE